MRIRAVLWPALVALGCARGPSSSERPDRGASSPEGSTGATVTERPAEGKSLQWASSSFVDAPISSLEQMGTTQGTPVVLADTITAEQPDVGREDPLDKRGVSARFSETPLEEVLRMLACLRSMEFTVDPRDEFLGNLAIEAEFHDVSCRELLDRLCEKNGLRWSFCNGRVVVSRVDRGKGACHVEPGASREPSRGELPASAAASATSLQPGAQGTIENRPRTVVSRGLAVSVDPAMVVVRRLRDLKFTVTFLNVSSETFLLFDIDHFPQWHFNLIDIAGGGNFDLICSAKYKRYPPEPIELLPSKQHVVKVDFSITEFLACPQGGHGWYSRLPPGDYHLFMTISLGEYVAWDKLLEERKGLRKPEERKWPHPFWTGTIKTEPIQVRFLP